VNDLNFFFLALSPLPPDDFDLSLLSSDDESMVNAASLHFGLLTPPVPVHRFIIGTGTFFSSS